MGSKHINFIEKSGKRPYGVCRISFIFRRTTESYFSGRHSLLKSKKQKGVHWGLRPPMEEFVEILKNPENDHRVFV